MPATPARHADWRCCSWPPASPLPWPSPAAPRRPPRHRRYRPSPLAPRPAPAASQATVPGALASFYRAPDPLPYAPAGTLVRSQAVVPGPGLPAGTRAYRVLYHSTTAAGGDLAESGVVVVPGGAPPAGGFPIVSWAHGTTGVASGCAPSVDGHVDPARPGRPDPQPVDRGRLRLPGPRDAGPAPVPGRDGRGRGRARRRPGRPLPGGYGGVRRVAVLGFSQGGQAALFAGEVAPTYAPDLSLAGVAAVAPVTSVLELAPTGDGPPPSGQSAFTAMVLYAWSRHYRTFGLQRVLTPAGLADLTAVTSSCVDTVASLYDAVSPGEVLPARDGRRIPPSRPPTGPTSPGTSRSPHRSWWSRARPTRWCPTPRPPGSSATSCAVSSTTRSTTSSTPDSATARPSDRLGRRHQPVARAAVRRSDDGVDSCDAGRASVASAERVG